MKRFAFLVLFFSLVCTAFAESSDLREYYYFFCGASTGTLYVLHVDEEGTVLDGPSALNTGECDGITTSKDAQGRIVLFTEEHQATGKGGVRRWIFTGPASVSGGQVVKGSTPWRYNISANELLPGVIAGSDEGTESSGLEVTSNGSATGKYFRMVPALDDIHFIDMRADGSEAFIISRCCPNKVPIVEQKLTSNFHASGSPIFVTKVDANEIFPQAIRISGNGQFLLAASFTQGLRLFKLSMNTRKPVKTTNIPAFYLTYYDATVINEDGTFFIYTEFDNVHPVVYVQFQMTDGQGNLVGSKMTLAELPEFVDHGDMIQGN